MTATLIGGGPRTDTAAPSSPSAPSAPRLEALTGLRWIAALLVFLTHAYNLGFFGPRPAASLVGWLRAGSTGVSLFFVLSGFVLAWSAGSRSGAGAFWRRRFARVYPLHLVTAAGAVLLLAGGIPGPDATSVPAAAANLLLVSAWHHPWWQALNPVSWSLVCEAFFYACFPAIMMLVRRSAPRWLGTLVVGSVVAVVALAAVAEAGALPVSLYDFPAARLPEFVAGVAAGQLVRLGRWRGPSMPVAATAAVLGYLLVPVVPLHFQTAATTIVGFVLLIPALATTRRAPAMLTAPIAVRLGTWSFAFYLTHLQVLWMVAWLVGRDADGAVARPAVGMLAALAVSVLLAGLGHRLVEAPGYRLLGGRTRTAVPPPASGTDR